MQSTEKKFDKKHLELWKQSGLSRKAYCDLNGISYHTFMYHLKRIREQYQGSSFAEISIPKKNSPVGIEFHLSNGNYFVFPPGYEAGEILKFISLC
jgi:hypothetical protein